MESYFLNSTCMLLVSQKENTMFEVFCQNDCKSEAWVRCVPRASVFLQRGELNDAFSFYFSYHRHLSVPIES